MALCPLLAPVVWPEEARCQPQRGPAAVLGPSLLLCDSSIGNPTDQSLIEFPSTSSSSSSPIAAAQRLLVAIGALS